jgi:hypothetical protein
LLNKQATIIVRPSFSIPFIKPPNMIPNVDEERMKIELTLKNLGGIKPEAPWIKRSSFGVQFTDCIQESHNLLETKEDNINMKSQIPNNQAVLAESE